MRDTIFRPFLALLIVATTQAGLVLTMPASAGVPGSHSQVNLDGNGVALGGYDPVAYFDGGKPTRRLNIAWCRWVASFVTRPKTLVEKLFGALRVGGKAVLHEYQQYSTWRT